MDVCKTRVDRCVVDSFTLVDRSHVLVIDFMMCINKKPNLHRYTLCTSTDDVLHPKPPRVVQISHGANVRDVTVYGCTDILLVSGSFLGEDLNVSMCVVQ